MSNNYFLFNEEEFFENRKEDTEFISRIGKMYEMIMATRKPENYTINIGQMKKFMEVYMFMADFAREMDGKITSIELNPIEIHAGITMECVVADLWGERKERCATVMEYISALSIDTLTSGMLCISVTIPDVFTEKEDAE